MRTTLCLMSLAALLAPASSNAAEVGPPDDADGGVAAAGPVTDSPIASEVPVDPGASSMSAAVRSGEPVPDPYGDVDFNVVHTDKFGLDIGGMVQLLGLGQFVNDPYAGKERVYVFLPKARLRLDGNYDRFSFNLQLALGGESAINATSGIDFSLLDFAVNLPITQSGDTYFKVGQFLVPYGREQLTDPGFQDFGGTSMEQQGFVVGRDIGLAIVSTPFPFTFIAGVFTGGGRDIPPDHYLPERFGIPELVARIGIGNLDRDPFYLRESEMHPEGLRAQLSGGVLYTRDSTVGHSTLLNVKSVDKSLLLDPNWNPFIAAGGVGSFSQGNYYQAGADAAVHVPLGERWALAGEAQIDFAGYSNAFGTVKMWGARIQGGLLRDPFEVALRYDVLVPSAQFAYAGTQITGSQPIHEIAPSASYVVVHQRLKAIVDLPILINAPIFTEPGVGQYVGTQLPDQVTVLAAKTGGTVTRRPVPQIRVMLQAQF